MSSMFGDVSTTSVKDHLIDNVELTKYKVQFASRLTKALHREKLSDIAIVAGGFPTQILNNTVMKKVLHGNNNLANFDNIDIDLFVDNRATDVVLNNILSLVSKYTTVTDVTHQNPLDDIEKAKAYKDKKSMFKLTQYCKVVNLTCEVKRPLSTSIKHTATFTLQIILFKQFDNYKELLDSFDLQVTKHAILHTSNTDLTILGSGVKSKGAECWLPDSVFNKSNGVSIDNYTYIKTSRTKALPISNLQSLSRYKKYIQRYRIMKYFKQEIDSGAIKNTVKVSIKDCSDALTSYRERMPFYIQNRGLASPVTSIICTLFNNAVNTYAE